MAVFPKTQIFFSLKYQISESVLGIPVLNKWQLKVSNTDLYAVP